MTQPNTPLSFGERLQRDYEMARAQSSLIGFTASQRQASLTKALAAGLPGLRDDDWRYARLRPVNAASWLPADSSESSVSNLPAQSVLPEPMAGFTRLTFINGYYCDGLSMLADAPEGLTGWTEVTWPDVADQQPADNVLQPGPAERYAWLNDLFVTDAAQLKLSGEVQLEFLFISTVTEAASASYPRLQLLLLPEAQVTLVERHLGSGGATALTNASVQLQLQAGARLQHYRVQAMERDAIFMDTLLATLHAGADYALTFINQGAATARSSLRLRLQGDNTQLSVHGVSLTDERCNCDTVIQVEHVGRNSRSKQVLRGVANGQSSIGLTSRVDVAASAGGADSRQSLKGLIGAAGAEVNLRPQLEINTDEVKASHGATTGSLDDNTLFYLLSRGLDPETARKLLEWAFIGDVMSHIEIAGLRRQVELATVSQLGNAAALEALL